MITLDRNDAAFGTSESDRCTRQLTNGLALNKEQFFTQAIGRPNIDPNLGHVLIDHNGVETFFYDGRPVIEFHPVEFETVSLDGTVTLKATQRYRRLASSDVPNPPSRA